MYRTNPSLLYKFGIFGFRIDIDVCGPFKAASTRGQQPPTQWL